MNYSDVNSNIDRKGFIDKDKILDLVTEEEIFEIVFGYKPTEYEKVCSPFRSDNNPGAWFERTSESGRLKFVDYADSEAINRDCFDCIKDFYNLPNFYQVLEFVYNYLIEGKDIIQLSIKNSVKKSIEKKEKKRVQILVGARNFNSVDFRFWFTRYGISRANLQEDKVIPVNKITMLNTKKGNVSFYTKTPCYAYLFEENRKKLYFPYKKGSERFLTNCKKSDVGGIEFLKEDVFQVIITKAYKDYRVLKNSGCNTVWFQNEGMFPEENICKDYFSRFLDVIIWFDNDESGIKAAKKLNEYFKTLEIPSRLICLPVQLLVDHNIKDPSDCRHKLGQKYLNNFLKSNSILCLKK